MAKDINALEGTWGEGNGKNDKIKVQRPSPLATNNFAPLARDALLCACFKHREKSQDNAVQALIPQGSLAIRKRASARQSRKHARGDSSDGKGILYI